MRILVLAVVGIVAGVLYFQQSGVSEAFSHNPGREVSVATDLATEQGEDTIDSFDNIFLTPLVEPEEGVADAASTSYLSILQNEADLDEQDYIAAAERLQSTWDPLYASAIIEHQKLKHRIDHLSGWADQYFMTQRNLTSQIADPELRTKTERQDQSEMRIYRRWKLEADAMLATAGEILSDLHDMDIVITKQHHSAHFRAMYQEFETLPDSLLELRANLDQFRESADNIRLSLRLQN